MWTHIYTCTINVQIIFIAHILSTLLLQSEGSIYMFQVCTLDFICTLHLTYIPHNSYQFYCLERIGFYTILVTIDIHNTCKQRSLILSLLLCCRLLRLFITRFLYLVSLDQRILTDWLQLPQATNYIIRWHERDALILVYTLRIYPKGNSIYETNKNKAIWE